MSSVRSDVVGGSYNLFDFYADPGAEHDEDNFIAKVQRRDIVLLGRLQSVSSVKTTLSLNIPLDSKEETLTV